jgi:hypothetical protein
MPNNDFTDFMLKEYECIAQAFFESREVLTKWFKYYLLVMALPFSFFALLYKEKPNDFNIYSLPSTLSILCTLIGFIGLFITFVMINAAYDSILYARSVNGVRQYFSEIENKIHVNDPDKLISKYLVLPVVINIPQYRNQFLTWIVVSATMINSFYLSLGISQIKSVKNMYFNSFYPISFCILLFAVFVLVHIGYYHITAQRNEKGL